MSAHSFFHSSLSGLSHHPVTAALLRRLLEHRPQGKVTTIAALPDAPYTLLRPIPVRLEPGEDGGWMARFEEANIGMSGGDPEDARQMLTEDIVETFALFLAEEATLGPGPQRQLAVLKQYLQVC